MTGSIRFGIIGCGGIARWHVNAIQTLDTAELTAVTDSSADRSEEWGRLYNVPWFTDAGKMLTANIVDAVCICTPSGLHAELAQQALTANRHVVVEKPAAITRESLKGLLRAEEKSEAKLCVVSQLRFSPDVLEAKRIIGDGLLGNIILADLSMKYYREPSYYTNSGWRGTFSMDGGGALMNQGIHGVDLLRFLCGDIREVYALSGTFLHDIETEDTLSATFYLEGGGLGTLTAATTAYPGHKRRLEICGTEGSLTLVEDKLIQAETKSGISIEKASTGKHGASDPFDIDYEPHQRQIRGFVEAVLSGKPFEPSIKEAAKTLEVIFSVYDSCKTGKPVKVEQL